METVSIRKKANEAIIIQNSKRVFKHLFTIIIIGMYCLLNFISIIRIDINLSYKFFSIWLFLVLFFVVRPALKRRGIKVFLKVNNQKIIIKKQKIFGKDEENSFLLKNIENMVIETERKGGKVLVIKMSNNIEDRSIFTADYVYDLRMIRKIILEYKAKGEEEWNF
ncbi:hypothetical protein LDJ90_07765 [Fusobacterium vincentii]|uniref:hypothetical protein n=1 Tax=Fusobacterium vincentii TaxID=155615 RepID=UPI000C1B7EA7|nr:hypothetical protein [Fusobacterium vincentii]ATV06838.1 hypothetical protein CS401_09050 [Fusobacterium vincentii]BET15730.1 hypothetical protein FVTDC_16650 [Fusobacterium vincentii]